jgi:hypothetical protein
LRIQLLQVIGAGFGRTGTHSLAIALDKLGFDPCDTLLVVDRNLIHSAQSVTLTGPSLAEAKFKLAKQN